MRLGIRDEVGVRLPRRIRAHGEHGRIGGDARNRLQVRDLVLRLASEDPVGFRQDGERRERHQDRVAVRLGLRDHAHADRAARPRLVLDDDGLSELAREGVGHGPSHGIRDATGRKGHDHRDRALGPVGGER